MEIDRTPKPCLHKRAKHEHGTRNCYTLDHCRCYPCSFAVSDYNHQLATGQIKGFYTAAEPVRRHVIALMEAGIGYHRIAELAGVSNTNVAALLYGKRGKAVVRVKSENARKLLALRVDQTPRAGGVRIDPIGTSRRLQSLVALGWTQAQLARRIGWTPANFGDLVHGRRAVNQSTADKVVALYEALSMTPPPQATQRERIGASRARNYAKARRWLPPLALDDERLDDPDYMPQVPKDVALVHEGVDEAAIERRMTGEKKLRLSRASKVELVRRWTASGRSLRECEEVTGINPYQYREDEQGVA
jgi:transcriptional regulator with XRE-family HTH domain